MHVLYVQSHVSVTEYSVSVCECVFVWIMDYCNHLKGQWDRASSMTLTDTQAEHSVVKNHSGLIYGPLLYNFICIQQVAKLLNNHSNEVQTLLNKHRFNLIPGLNGPWVRI